MKEMLERLSGQSEPDDSHAEAKMQVLQELRNMAMDMMGEKVKGKMPREMHGVEVMAPDQEGLAKGLDLAKKVLPEGSPEEEASESPQEEAMEMSSDESMYEDMSPDEIQEQIDHLEQLKQSKMMR
jgi:hypothetical protein